MTPTNRKHETTLETAERAPGAGWTTLLRLLLAAAVALLLQATSALAGQSDLALFSSSNGAAPNIMLMLDDSGSMSVAPSWCSGGSGGDDDDDDEWWWSGSGSGSGTPDCRDKILIMRDAAIDLINDTNPADGLGGYQQNVRFGVFVFDSNHHGGMLLAPLADDNTADVLYALNNQISAGGSTPLGGTMVDIGRYFGGSSEGYGTLPKFGTLAYNASSPFTTEQTPSDVMDLSCRESFVIAMSDGEGQSTRGDKYPNSTLWATVGDADGDGQETANTDEEWMDDAAYDMFRRDFRPGLSGTQNITTHTVAFDLDGAGATFLKKVALNGGGSYSEANSDAELSEAFRQAAQSVFSSLGSFTGATVSSSRTNQGDLFINSYFEPLAQPVWQGHMEAFRIAADGEIQGLDTSTTPPTYVPAVDSVTKQLIAPPIWDAAPKLAVNASRRIITPNSSFTAMIDVTTGNLNATTELDLTTTATEAPDYPNYPASGINTQSELETAVIRYLRGKDAFDEDGDGSKTDMRNTVLGDIFHSTPIMVGKPTTFLAGEDGFSGFLSSNGTRDRVVYAGANDVLLHAFDAGEWKTGDDPLTTDVTESGYYSTGTGTNSVNGGEEIFGFVPRRLIDEIKTLPLNHPRLRYYVDGSPTVADAWLGDQSGLTDKVKDEEEWATVMVVGLREGGRAYAALDITNPASSSYPGILWEFSDADLGFAWSKPVIGRVKVREATGYGDHCGTDDGDGDCREQWVAVFGGGYEANTDPNDSDFVETSASVGFTTRSKAMYVVALDTGAMLAKVALDESGSTGPAEMKYAIPGSPSVLDLDFDGFVDVIYMGDVGGQVWKWDISSIATLSGGVATNWPAGVFFRTPTTTVGSVTRYRSFFTSPAAAYVKGALTLSFGSGEREDLFYAGSAGNDENNRFYVVRDFHPTGASAFTSVTTDSNLVDVTDGSLSPGATGYYIKVPDGEKFISEASVFAGFVVATSFQPAAGSDACSTASGQASLYVFEISSAEGLFDDGTASVEADRFMLIGGGMPSAPKISMGENAGDDVIYIKTSTGQVIVVDAPPRSDGQTGLLYWQQVF